jgi:pyruvate,water dikinase
VSRGVVEIAWLGPPASPSSRSLVGGKGAGLDRLARAHLPVPPAFCLTAEADRLRLAALGLADRLPAGEAERAAFEARVRETPLPPALAEQLEAALARLGGDVVTVAVRSSGLDEDARHASFAGLHCSALGVSPADVPAAVTECWASAWSSPAVSYRVRRGLGPPPGMAVVVQRMVAARAAAVAFTADPLTAARTEVVICATRGLGLGLVGGAVVPDTLRVDRVSGLVLDAEEGEKHETTHLDAAGRVVTEADGRRGLSLTEREAGDLAALALAAEDVLGVPADVEAAHDGRAWQLLQARAITT